MATREFESPPTTSNNQISEFLQTYSQLSTVGQVTSLIGVLTGLFSFAFIIGWFNPSTTVTQTVQEPALATASGLQYSTIEIFIHNASIGLLAAVLGVFILPVVAIIGGNGYYLGHVLGGLSTEYGSQAILFVAPHGLFEIPAIVFASAAGIRMGLLAATYEFNTLRTNGLLRGVKQYIALVSVSMLLFAIAAIIETTLTLSVINALI